MRADVVNIEPNLNGEGLRVGVVMARFNLPVCEGLRDACLEELGILGVQADDITFVTVPGALEIPLALQAMAQNEDDAYDALIALGAVIRGETYHFELVSNEAGSALTRVGLDFDIPVANGVLTCDTDAQAEARMDEKGRDCARCAVEMANLQKAFYD